MITTQSKPTEHINKVFNELLEFILPKDYTISASGETAIIKKDKTKIVRIELKYNHETKHYDDYIVLPYIKNDGYRRSSGETAILRIIGDVVFTLSLCETKFFNKLNS